MTWNVAKHPDVLRDAGDRRICLNVDDERWWWLTTDLFNRHQKEENGPR
jgi:hypothetical protein